MNSFQTIRESVEEEIHTLYKTYCKDMKLKRRLSRNTLNKLSRDFSILQLGLRMCILLDYIDVFSMENRQFLSYIVANSIIISKRVHLLDLGDGNLFLFLSQQTCSYLKLIIETEGNQLFFVDVDSSLLEPRKSSLTNKNRILSKANSLLDSITLQSPFPSIIQLHLETAFILSLSGILLGYKCIYLLNSPDHSLSHCLSSQTLLCVSLYHHSQPNILLTQYTVPLNILEQTTTNYLQEISSFHRTLSLDSQFHSQNGQVSL